MDLSWLSASSSQWWSTFKTHAQSAFLLSSSLSNFSAPAIECTETAFAGVLPSNAKITKIHSVLANGTWPNTSPLFLNPTTGLPELCAVIVNVESSSSSSYNFGLFLPQEWNRRFMATGNGGYGGGINWNDMGSHSYSGFATMSTDTGHLSAPFDAEWALNNPESQIDWAHRAMHGSVELSKTLIHKYYGSKVKYSYYSSCSTGGRQGLKEIQMYPNDFDGVVAAAPAWWTSHLQTWSLEVSLWNLPSDAPHHIPSSLFPIIGAEVLKQCDPQDGLIDGIISSPTSCTFFPETLLCGPKSNPETCLTPPQIQTLNKIYSPWIEFDNTFVFTHFPLGSETQYPFCLNTDSGKPSHVGTRFVENFVYNDTDPDRNWLSKETFNYTTTLLADEIKVAGGATADNFDLSPFAARGGKLIMYHGWADGLIPTGSSLYFYTSVLSTLVPKGISVSNFLKLYLIPGMQHCFSSVGDAPWYINGGNQAVFVGNGVRNTPEFGDERFNVVRAVMRWVEDGIPPRELVATKWVEDNPEKGVRRQRPICPHPERAGWDGVGDPDLSESWKCKGLYEV